MHELQVENISCGQCVAAVTRAVRALDPQAQVDVDLAARMVKVESGVLLSSISAAIVAAGYPVSSAR